MSRVFGSISTRAIVEIEAVSEEKTKANRCGVSESREERRIIYIVALN